MSASPVRRGVLLGLAVEGVLPVLGGCAGALAGGPEGGLAGVAVGQVVERAINIFGARIVERWQLWLRAQPPEARQAALADLAAFSPQEARAEAAAALDRLAPDANPADRSIVLEYLSIIPRTIDRALLKDSANGSVSLPATISFDQPQALLQLLPTGVPPYPTPSELPGTPYRLEQVLGSGGFGTVYRATASSLQHLPFAVKFCLDPTLIAGLHQERSNLERLMKAGGENWSPRIVRLYGYDLHHATPYLVYEFVPGGDLIHYLARRERQLGRPLNAGEVLALIIQVCEALAFAHNHGLVHRDLKPANILVDGDTLKLADFGLGAVTAARALQVSRIGVTTLPFLSLAEQASLFRGAGTPLYMAPEQRRGAAPDPRHDLYSLGVMWFQFLAGDVSRELHPGWAKELAVRFRVPAAHLALIERCVGWLDERPRDAAELLPLLRKAAEASAEPAAAPATPPPPSPGADQGVVRKWLGAVLESAMPLPQAGALDEARRKELVKLLMEFENSFFQGTESRARQQEVVQRLIREFPEEVQSWGGVARMHTNPLDWCRRILRGLRNPTLSEAERLRRVVLVSMLKRLARCHADVERRNLWVPLLLGLPFALLVGWLVGEVNYSLWHDVHTFPNAFRAVDVDWKANLTGVVSGAAVLVVFVFFSLARRASNRPLALQQSKELIEEIAREYPEEVKSWGGAAVLRHRDAIRTIVRELQETLP
jgi:serine/threonine protein kinase